MNRELKLGRPGACLKVRHNEAESEYLTRFATDFRRAIGKELACYSQLKAAAIAHVRWFWRTFLETS